MVGGSIPRVCNTRAPFQCPMSCRIVRSRECSKPRDWKFELWHRVEMWQAHRQHCCRGACQISERTYNYKWKSRSFRDCASCYETSSCISKRSTGVRFLATNDNCRTAMQLTWRHSFYVQGSSAVFILNSTPTQLKTQLSWVIPWVGVLFCVLSWVGNVTQLVGSVGGLSQIPWQHALSTAQLPWKRHVTADDTVQNGGVPDGWQFLRYAAIGRLFLTAQEAKVG